MFELGPAGRAALRAAACLLALSASFGAHAQGDEIPPGATVISIPETADRFNVGTGETVAAIATIYTYDGIELKSPINARQRGGSGAGRPTVVIEPQYLVARSEDSHWIYYSGNVIYNQAGVINTTGELGTAGLQTRVGGLRINKDNPDDIEIWVRQHRGRGFFIEEPPVFESATIGAGEESNTAKELAFGGVEGNEIILIYREHAGTSTEPVHEEAVRTTFAAGETIAVRGVRLEVVDASESGLTFRVLENFAE